MDHNVKLIIDMQLYNFLKKKLDDDEAFRAVYEIYCTKPWVSRGRSLLALIATQKLSGVGLCLIDEFLESLSLEEMSEYFGCVDENYKTLISNCKDIELLKIIIKYANRINATVTCRRKCSVLTEIFNFWTSIKLDTVQLLLDCDVDVNIADYSGCTPLMGYCVNHGIKAEQSSTWAPRLRTRHSNSEDFESIVELLIYRGADVSIKACRGETVYDCAMMSQIILSDKLSKLLRGEIGPCCTKSAMKVR